jgi:hypothetical protein
LSPVRHDGSYHSQFQQPDFDLSRKADTILAIVSVSETKRTDRRDVR